MIFDYNDGNRLQFNERNPCPNWSRSRHDRNEWNLNCGIVTRAMILSYPSPCACCCLSLVFSSVSSSSYGIGEGKRRILFILVLCCALLCALLCLYRWTLYIRSIHGPFWLFLALFGRVLTVTSPEPSLKLSEWRAGEHTIVHFYRKWPLEKIKKLPEEHGTTEVKNFEIFKNLPYSPSSVEQTENKRQLPPDWKSCWMSESSSNTKY